MDFTSFMIILFLIFLMFVGVYVANKIIKIEEDYSNKLEERLKEYQRAMRELRSIANEDDNRPYILRNELNDLIGRLYK